MNTQNKDKEPMYLKANSFTVDPMAEVKLTEEQIRFYWDNGYVVVKELIDFSSLYSFKRRFIQICNMPEKPGQMIVMKDLELVKKGLTGEKATNKLQDILHDDTFTLYFENPKVLSVVAQIIGDDITASHSMFINKPPGIQRHPPHQDLYYFPFRPADKIVASWTAVDDVTVDNGCLYVIPRSHKAGQLYEHDYPVKDGVKQVMYHGIIDEVKYAPESQRVNLEMSPGDTVFFHPLLVHGSGVNHTNNYRKSISCHYSSSHCQYLDVKGTIQDKIAREVEMLANKRGIDAPFELLWKLKSKIIKGRVKSLL